MQLSVTVRHVKPWVQPQIWKRKGKRKSLVRSEVWVWREREPRKAVVSCEPSPVTSPPPGRRWALQGAHVTGEGGVPSLLTPEVTVALPRGLPWGLNGRGA